MPKDAILHVRIDPDDKAKAEELYANLGTSLSEAVRMFIKQSIKDNGFPFQPIASTGKGQMKAQGRLSVYAHQELRESERAAWIRSLDDKYETANR
ncbi:MAG: type II toxin-antitoxin system RelB/DinJ family antitoxin [Eggerthellaceae bacterium]|jgi:DNA-damage-inducible protein J